MPGTAVKIDSTDFGCLSKVAAHKAEELSEKLLSAGSSPESRESMVFEVISALEEYPDERAALAARIIFRLAAGENCDQQLLQAVASGAQRYFQIILDRDSESALVGALQSIKMAPGISIEIRNGPESTAVGETPLLEDEAKMLLNTELKGHSVYMRKLMKEIIELGELDENESLSLTFERLWNRASKKLEAENRPLWSLSARATDNDVYEQVNATLLVNSRKGIRLADIRTEAIKSVKSIVSKLRIALHAEANFTSLDKKTRKDLLESLRHMILYLKRYDGLDPRDSTFSAETVRGLLDLGSDWNLIVRIRIAFYDNDAEKVNELFSTLLTMASR